MKILLIEIEIYIFALAEAAASSYWQADKNSKVVTGITNFAPFSLPFRGISKCVRLSIDFVFIRREAGGERRMKSQQPSRER